MTLNPRTGRGINATIILMVYYFIPLSSLWEVIKSKNAISIYIPLAIGATANGCLWTAYGFALKVRTRLVRYVCAVHL